MENLLGHADHCQPCDLTGLDWGDQRTWLSRECPGTTKRGPGSVKATGRASLKIGCSTASSMPLPGSI